MEKAYVFALVDKWPCWSGLKFLAALCGLWLQLFSDRFCSGCLDLSCVCTFQCSVWELGSGLGAGQWSGSWAVVWELGGSLGAGQWSGSWAVVWELGSGLLSQSGVLIRTRPMHVQLGNPLQNSKTTLWSRFPRFFALCDLSDICPFLGSLKGVKESRLGTLSVLVQILVFFPQIGLLQFTFQNLKVAAPSVLSRFSSAVFSGRARVPRDCSA